MKGHFVPYTFYRIKGTHKQLLSNRVKCIKIKWQLIQKVIYDCYNKLCLCTKWNSNSLFRWLSELNCWLQYAPTGWSFWHCGFKPGLWQGVRLTARYGIKFLDSHRGFSLWQVAADKISGTWLLYMSSDGKWCAGYVGVLAGWPAQPLRAPSTGQLAMHPMWLSRGETILVRLGAS